MEFTKNEKQVLKLLLDNGRMSDADMARTMDISTQAVRKIRKKLEANKTIQGYSVSLDPQKMGINSFALTLWQITDKWLAEEGEQGIAKYVRGVQPAVFASRLPSTEAHLTGIVAFRDEDEREKYLLAAQSLKENTRLIKAYPFSSRGVIKNSIVDLYKHVLTTDEPLASPMTRDRIKEFDEIKKLSNRK